MSSKPAVVIVTGSFCLAEWYKVIGDPLEAQGFEVAIPQFLTAGRKPGPLPTLYDDAAMIASKAREFADQSKDVVLIAHSYGGTVASEAVKGLSKKERSKEGKKGGIIRIGFMTCLVPDEGLAAASANDPDAFGDYLSVGEDGWMEHFKPEETAKYCFNNLSVEEGTKWAAKFIQHSSASFGNPMTYAGYKDVASSWLLAENDKCIPPEYQQKGIDRIEAASGRKVDVTKGPYDHCPPMDKPEETVEWVLSVLKAGE